MVDGGELVSAPISFFDSTLMSFLADDWQKVTRVVGEALACQMDDCIFQTGDILLAARVNALAESGRLEVKGKSPLDMRFSEVRIAKAR